jgi:hypothetical protein
MLLRYLRGLLAKYSCGAFFSGGGWIDRFGFHVLNGRGQISMGHGSTVGMLMIHAADREGMWARRDPWWRQLRIIMRQIDTAQKLFAAALDPVCPGRGNGIGVRPKLEMRLGIPVIR